MKDFGIIYLNDKCIKIDNKGNRYKKFKSIITNEEYEVKTKRTELIQTYCVVNHDDKTILEYCDNINNDYNLIVEKIGLLNWSIKFNKNFKLDTNIYLIDTTPDRTYYKGNIISVDPIGCKDIDDAIQLIEHDDLYEIFIHISDPSSYIPINSPLDNEIKNRNSSLYLSNTYHMLPDTLSTNIISLLENEERRAYSCVVKIKKDIFKNNNSFDFNDIDFEFKKSIIIVSKNMSYDEFTSEFTSKINQNDYYKKIYDVGFKLYNKLNLDTNGDYDSHKMIEAYMILCNICASYKCKIKRATINESDSIYNSITEYILENKEHKMIGFQYTHFTSPIRRYVDILVHRLILNPNSYTDFELINLIQNVNNKNKILKKVYNIYNLLNLMNESNEIDIKARIVYIEQNNIKLMYDNKILNVYIDMRLINNKIININYKKNELIEIIHNEYGKIYKINDIVDLKIYFLKNEINPFKIVLYDTYLNLI
jgi:exoribonuclease R